MPKRAVAAERETASQAATAAEKPLPQASLVVRNAIEAGIVSRRMVFPDQGPAKTIETWRPPVIKDPEIGEAIWSRLTELNAHLSPAPRQALMARILVLLAHYRPTADVGTLEQAMADDWAEDLAIYPLWVIETAARTWRRTKKFKPQIAEMIELCDEAMRTPALEHQRLLAIAKTAARARNPLAERTAKIARGLFTKAPEDEGDRPVTGRLPDRIAQPEPTAFGRNN